MVNIKKLLTFIFCLNLLFPSHLWAQVNGSLVAESTDNKNLVAQNDFVSLSDLAIEDLISARGAGARNPFSPGTTEEEFDPQSLSVQGIVIGPDTKFDGVGNWGEDKTFRFRTIRYRGI